MNLQNRVQQLEIAYSECDYDYFISEEAVETYKAILKDVSETEVDDLIYSNPKYSRAYNKFNIYYNVLNFVHDSPIFKEARYDITEDETLDIPICYIHHIFSRIQILEKEALKKYARKCYPSNINIYGSILKMVFE